MTAEIRGGDTCADAYLVPPGGGTFSGSTGTSGGGSTSTSTAPVMPTSSRASVTRWRRSPPGSCPA